MSMVFVWDKSVASCVLLVPDHRDRQLLGEKKSSFQRESGERISFHRHYMLQHTIVSDDLFFGCFWCFRWSLIDWLVSSFIHSFIHSFVHSFIGLFLFSFIRFFIRSFLRSLFPSFIHPFMHSFVCLFHSFVPSLVSSFVRSLIRAFIRAFVHSYFIYPFNDSAIIHAFVYSSIHIPGLSSAFELFRLPVCQQMMFVHESI